MPQNILSHIVETLRHERNIEDVVRNFLEIIELSTGVESAYLTRIDMGNGVQTILFARNTQSMVIPEGLSVPWGDTLCKRALDEKCPYTNNVAERWGDSEAAKALGIQTYMSTPILIDQRLYGTLCAASSHRVIVKEQKQQLLTLFGEIISLYLEREGILEKLQSANRILENVSLTDPLTGLHNRRYLLAEMKKAYSLAERNGHVILVAVIDLDDFKRINDQYGHNIGDEFLVAIAQRLLSASRASDLVARMGGDEFVVVVECPASAENIASATLSLRNRLETSLSGVFDLSSITLDYSGPSIGIVDIQPGTLSPEQAMQLADEAMYAVKRARKQAAGPTSTLVSTANSTHPADGVFDPVI